MSEWLGRNIVSIIVVVAILIMSGVRTSSLETKIEELTKDIDDLEVVLYYRAEKLKSYEGYTIVTEYDGYNCKEVVPLYLALIARDQSWEGIEFKLNSEEEVKENGIHTIHK